MSTITVYPAAGANSPCDGYVRRGNALDETFTTLRNEAGTSFNVTATEFDITLRSADNNTPDQFSRLNEGMFLFDTSAIGSGNTVSATVFSLFGRSKANTIGSPVLHIVSAAPAATDTLAASDYRQVGSTSFGNVTYANFDGTDTVYTDITLNASGIANVSKTGISKFGAILNWDLDNSFSGTWVGFGVVSGFNPYAADSTGTTNDPKLVVTYAAPAVGPVNLKTYNTNVAANIKTINTNVIANVKSLNTNV